MAVEVLCVVNPYLEFFYQQEYNNLIPAPAAKFQHYFTYAQEKRFNEILRSTEWTV